MAENAATLGQFDFAGDDHVVPFQVEGLDVRGRAVQLGPLLDAILARHDYPTPVARLLAEAIVLTVLLGTSLKFEGKFTVQTKGDGPVDLLVADFTTPENVRAYARFDEEALEKAVAEGGPSRNSCSARASSPSPSIRAVSASPIRALSRLMAPRSKRLPAPISVSRSRSRRACVWGRQNFRP